MRYVIGVIFMTLVVIASLRLIEVMNVWHYVIISLISLYFVIRWARKRFRIVITFTIEDGRE